MFEVILTIEIIYNLIILIIAGCIFETDYIV